MNKIKKFSLTGLCVASFMLTSCTLNGISVPDNIPTTIPDTVTTEGSDTTVTTTSDVTSTEQENHVHSVTKVEFAKPTSDTAGNIEYYKCACGKLYAYQDMTGELTIEQTVLSYSKIESYYDDDKQCLAYVTEIYKNYKGESFEEHTLSYDVNGNLTDQTNVCYLFDMTKNWEKVGKYFCVLLPNDEVTQYTEIYKNGKISQTSSIDTSGKITIEEYNYDGEILHDIKITGIKDEKVYTKGSVTFGPDNTSTKIYDESYAGDDWNNHEICTYQLKGEEILQRKIEEYKDGVLVKIETVNYENGTSISIDVCEYENGKLVKEKYTNNKPTTGAYSISENTYVDLKLKNSLTFVYDANDNLIEKYNCEITYGDNGKPVSQRVDTYDVESDTVTSSRIYNYDEEGNLLTDESITVIVETDGKKTYWKNNTIIYKEWEEDGLSARKDYVYTDETHVTMTTTYKDADGNIAKIFYQEPQEEHPELVAFTTETVFTSNGKTVTYTNYMPEEGTKKVIEEVYDSRDIRINVTLTTYNGDTVIAKQLNDFSIDRQERFYFYDVTTGKVTHMAITYRDENGAFVSKELIYYKEDGKVLHEIDDKLAYEEWVEDDLNALLAYEYTDGKNVGYSIFYKNEAGEQVKKVHLDMNPDTYTTNSIVAEYYSDGVTYKKEQKSYIDTTDYYSVTVYYYADGRCFLAEFYQYDENDKVSSKMSKDFYYRADRTIDKAITTFYNVEFNEVDYKVIYDYNEDGTDIILATMVKTSGGFTDYTVDGVLQLREYVSKDSTDNPKEYNVTETYYYTTEGALEYINITWYEIDNPAKCYKYIVKTVDQDHPEVLTRLLEQIFTDDEQKRTEYDYVNHCHTTMTTKYVGTIAISMAGEQIDDNTNNLMQTFTRTYDGTADVNLVSSEDIYYYNGEYNIKVVISNGIETKYNWSKDKNDWVLVEE